MPESSLEMTSPGYAVAVPEGADAIAAAQTQAGSLTMSAEGDTALPDQVAYMPAEKPGAAIAVAEEATATMPEQPAPSQPEQTVADAAAVPQPLPAQPAEQTAAPAPQDSEFFVASAPQEPIAPKKKGFLSSFFGSTPARAAPRPMIQQAEKPTPIIENSAETKPIITLASAKSQADRRNTLASLGDDSGSYGSSALPGVRQTALFEIKRKSGIDDDSDVDLHEDEEEGPIQLASAAGLARLAPNGLLKQTDRVDTACLKPSLVRVLKQIERHYGKKVVITSGYRSPARNRAARGAKNSLHMYCAAADIQIPGVNHLQLASYLRSMPGRGGVGTYCHTKSIHVDVGPERDWNWRCRRRKG